MEVKENNIDFITIIPTLVIGPFFMPFMPPRLITRLSPLTASTTQASLQSNYLISSNPYPQSQTHTWKSFQLKPQNPETEGQDPSFLRPISKALTPNHALFVQSSQSLVVVVVVVRLMPPHKSILLIYDLWLNLSTCTKSIFQVG
ncbi:hypothetical protein GBA52_003782 [Prunus armeniaca]|nr:hypothetical protein GBA52_003782 [Prunus armeniaca]